MSGRAQAEARDKLAGLRRDLEAIGRPSARTTLAEYLTGWLKVEEHRVRAATWRGRELHVRAYLAPALGAIALADLRPSDVERMTGAIVRGGKSGQTARHVRATLRRALGDAQRDGLIVGNVASCPGPSNNRALSALSAGY